MSTLNLITSQVTIFFLLAIGVLLYKYGIISDKGKQDISDLVLNVLLPSSIICSFEAQTQSLMKFSVTLLIGTFVVFFSALAAYFIYRIVNIPQQKVLRYSFFCPNAGMMGTAIVGEIFGNTGTALSAFYCIPLRIIYWSVGVGLFTEEKGVKRIRKALLHPCVIAVMVGVILMLTGITLPRPFDNTLKYLGNACTALSMIIVGTVVAEIPYKSLCNRQVLLSACFRLIVIPAIVCLACRLCRVDRTVTSVCVLLTGMPIGSTTALMALRYGADAELATKCVAVSTLCSMLTVPLWSIFLPLLFG